MSGDARERDDDAIEAGRKLFAGPCTFAAGATRIAALPPPGLPEAAFAGRSNVGKSSLVNALTGRRTLARISATPGRTQQINFFDLGHRLMLVDLPGYGFARAAKGRVRSWNRLIELYLRGRPTLRRVMLLIDARRGIGDTDRDAMDAMDAAAVAYQVVLTKCDKVKASDLPGLDALTAAEVAKRPAAHPGVILTSARDGLGIEALRAELAGLAEPDAPRAGP